MVRKQISIMGILDVFRRFFGKKRSTEALASEAEAIQKRFEALPSSARIFEKTIEPVPSPPSSVPEPLQVALEKESLQLGVAAGYTGRSIKEIESSLSRIESNMITKDWFSLQFPNKADLSTLFNKLDENEQKRFEAIQSLLLSLQKTTVKVPEPIKTELITQIKEIEKQLPLSPKMEALLLVVKEFKEISYADLASKLGVSISALRGLLTNTVRRTNKIQRFSKQGKGWVKYVESD
jgi:hypothetical protein